MRRLIFTLLIFPFLMSGCNMVSKEEMGKASEFNSTLVNYSMPITEKYNSLISSTKTIMNNAIQGNLSSNDINQVVSELEALKDLINTNMDSVKTLDEFDDKIRFKEASIKYLSVCKESLEKEFTDLIESVQKEMTQENILVCGKLIITIFENLMNIEKETKTIQRKFADKYMFDLPKEKQNWDMLEKQIENYKKQLESIENEE